MYSVAITAQDSVSANTDAVSAETAWVVLPAAGYSRTDPDMDPVPHTKAQQRLNTARGHRFH